MLFIIVGLLCIVGAFTDNFQWVPFMIGVLFIITGAFNVCDDVRDDRGYD